MTRTRTAAMEERGQSKAATPIQETQPVAEKAPRSRAGSYASLHPPDSNAIPTEEAAGTQNEQNMENIDEQSNMTDSTVTQSQTGKGKRIAKGKNNAPKRARVWTSQKEEKLIEMYEERKFLFNMSESGYHNRNKKTAAVRHIAKEVGVTGMFTCVESGVW